jgi:hypothetical protein
VLDLTRAAALLKSPDTAGLLRAALTGSSESALPDFRAELTTWQYRPGAEVTAGYRTAYTLPDGHQVEDHLLATTATVSAPATRVTRDGLVFHVWRHPGDPRLPGLAAACDPGLVESWPGCTGLLRLDLLGYRPLRRAVLRASGTSSVAYLKVLRPERADRLAVRQELLAREGLTQPLAGRPVPGVLVTAAAPGRSLAELLSASGALPSPVDLVGLLGRLPDELMTLDRRPSWSERLDFHAATAVERLPSEAARIAALAARVQQVLDGAPVGPLVPTHGDFYEANIMVDGDRLRLIDLENAGPGRREDDLACLLAHLAVLPGLSPDHYPRVPDVLAEWTQDFSTRVHPAALSARVAAVLLSLVAGGPGRQAEHRLRLAEEWADAG